MYFLPAGGEIHIEWGLGANSQVRQRVSELKRLYTTRFQFRPEGQFVLQAQREMVQKGGAGELFRRR